MFEVTYKLTDFFFDRLKVENRLAAKERRAMSKVGAFVRTDARQSIKRRKSSSPPDSPPSAHSKDKVATLKNILFGFDPSSHSVVVGPVLLRRSTRKRAFYLERSRRFVRKSDAKGIKELEGGVWVSDIKPDRSVTAMTEFGGSASAIVDDQATTFNYEPRPFMGPALERQRSNGKLIEAWKDLL